MQKDNTKPEYISKSGLKGKRGWTDLLITHFLPVPDKMVDNPYYKSSPQMNLYLLEKVIDIELTPAFITMMDLCSVRKKSAGKAIETKKNKIIAYINKLTIELPDISKEELIKRACNSYNNHNDWKRHEEWSEFIPASEESDWAFLNRICTNYLRHNCSKYERELSVIFGKVGVQDAYQLLKDKINKVILEKFDYLEEINQLNLK